MGWRDTYTEYCCKTLLESREGYDRDNIKMNVMEKVCENGSRRDWIRIVSDGGYWCWHSSSLQARPFVEKISFVT